jgi:hypothetical protein
MVEKRLLCVLDLLTKEIMQVSDDLPGKILGASKEGDRMFAQHLRVWLKRVGGLKRNAVNGFL